jgi:type IV pilus biogenesis protein CpaD/CtpE
MSFKLHSSHLLTAVTIGGAMLSLIGCANTPKPPPDRRIINDDVQYAADQQFVKEPFDEQARLGIVRQRTLFEADFQIDSAALSPLGRKDVTILAQAVLENGGHISVRQGSASAELYAARIAEVRARLVAAGVQVERIELVDRHAGGPGEATAEALIIRKDIRSIPLPNPIGEKLNPQGGGSMMQGKQ